MRLTGIYSITNTVSCRVYVGSATYIQRRFAQHRHALRKGTHHSPRLQNSWDKHGEDAFVFEVIEECHSDALTEREQFWIDEMHALCRRRGMNVRPDATSNTGVKRTPEYIAAMSARLKGRKRPLEERLRISEALRGRTVSPETREKIAASRRGKVASDKTRAKISAANAGRDKSVFDKMSASSKRRWSNPAERERYREIGRRSAAARWSKVASQ